MPTMLLRLHVLSTLVLVQRCALPPPHLRPAPITAALSHSPSTIASPFLSTSPASLPTPVEAIPSISRQRSVPSNPKSVMHGPSPTLPVLSVPAPAPAPEAREMRERSHLAGWARQCPTL